MAIISQKPTTCFSPHHRHQKSRPVRIALWYGSRKRNFCRSMGIPVFPTPFVRNIHQTDQMFWRYAPITERSLWEWLAVPKTWQAGCKSALMFCRNIAPKDWERIWSRCCATVFYRNCMRFHFMEPVLQTTILGTSPFAADSDRHGWKSVPKNQIYKNPFSI